MHRAPIGFLMALLAGCGGTTANTPSETAHPDEHEAPEPAPPPALGDARAVPGSRISVRLPEGAQGVPQPGVFIADRLVVIVGDSDNPFAEAGQAVLNGWEHEVGRIEEREDLQLEEHQAVLARGGTQSMQGARVRSWMLVVGDERGTSYVSVTGDADDHSLARSVMESVRWNPERDIDAVSFFGVQLDEVEGLTLDRESNQAIHFVEGADEDSPGNASFIVMFVTFPRPLTEGEYAQALGAALGDFEPHDLTTGQALIAGESSFEATGQGTLDDVDVALYGAIVPSGPGAFVILAHVGADRGDPYVDRFRTLARSLRR